MIKKTILVGFFAFVSFLFCDFLVGANDSKKDTEMELVQQLMEKWANDPDEKEQKFLNNAQDILQQAVCLCDDLKAQIGWWNKICLKIKKKTIYETEIGKLLEKVEEVKDELAKMIQNSDGTKDLNGMDEKLKGIRKVVGSYKRAKERANNNSKWKYPKSFLKWCLKKGNPLAWMGYAGNYVGGRISKGLGWALSIGTTILFFMALAGVVNGCYFSSSFISGFVAPFSWMWTFMSYFWRIIKKMPAEQAAEQAEKIFKDGGYWSKFVYVLNYGYDYILWKIGLKAVAG